MWGIIPAVGADTRIRPLAFSKELFPVGSRFENNTERPRTASEHLIERMLVGLPDTIWSPLDGHAALPDDGLSFLLFPVAQPRFLDAVVTDREGRV